MNLYDILAYLAFRASIEDVTLDASADQNGTAFDRNAAGINSAKSVVLCVSMGNATGSPTAETHRVYLQHAQDDGSGSPDAGDWADYDPEDGSDIWVTVAGDGATPQTAVRGYRLDRAKRHLRARYDNANSSFTGGASPDNDFTALLVFGGGDELPMS